MSQISISPFLVNSSRDSQFITFDLGGGTYAFGISYVREVLDLSPVTRLPSSPPYLLGMIDIRGEAIPLIDLRKKFSIPHADRTSEWRIMVLEIPTENEVKTVGTLADRVHEVIELPESELSPPPDLGSTWKSIFVDAVAHRNNQLIMLLQVNGIFFVFQHRSLPIDGLQDR